MYKLWEALKEAKKYHWVELSHSLNNDSPYWAGTFERCDRDLRIR